jgi:D-alanyl-D-alanine dipeptidase
VIQQEFAKASGLNLLGSIEYNPAHNLWSLWQATPEFQVPGPNGP